MLRLPNQHLRYSKSDVSKATAEYDLMSKCLNFYILPSVFVLVLVQFRIEPVDHHAELEVLGRLENILEQAVLAAYDMQFFGTNSLLVLA